MCGVDAMTQIASMVNVQALWDNAMRQHVGKAMRIYTPLYHVEDSVAGIRSKSPSPGPTFVTASLVNSAPKAVNGSLCVIFPHGKPPIRQVSGNLVYHRAKEKANAS